MLILFKGYNNHSNRLIQAIHLDAFCIENNLRFYNPSFWKMAKWYGLNHTGFDFFVWVLLCSLNKLRLLPKLKFTKEEKHELYANALRQKKHILVHGWQFRNFDLTEKHRDKLVEKYSLLPEF